MERTTLFSKEWGRKKCLVRHSFQSSAFSLLFSLSIFALQTCHFTRSLTHTHNYFSIGIFEMVCQNLRNIIGTRDLDLKDLALIAKKEVDRLALLKEEIFKINVLWGAHLSLLKTYDELDMCRGRVELNTNATSNVKINAHGFAADDDEDEDEDSEENTDLDNFSARGRQVMPSWKLPIAFQKAHAEASEKEGELRKATSTMLFYKTLETDKTDTVRRQKQRMQQQEDEEAGYDFGLLGSGKGSGGKPLFDDSDCTICMASFNEGDLLTLLECGHSFCSNCIKDWYKQCLTGKHFQLLSLKNI